jgi:hypothetical protein
MVLTRKDLSALRNTWHSATLSTTNLTWTDLKSAKGRRGIKFGIHSVHTHNVHKHSVHTHALTGAGPITLPCYVGNRRFCTAVQLPAYFAIHHVQ